MPERRIEVLSVGWRRASQRWGYVIRAELRITTPERDPPWVEVSLAFPIQQLVSFDEADVARYVLEVAEERFADAPSLLPWRMRTGPVDLDAPDASEQPHQDLPDRR